MITILNLSTFSCVSVLDIPFDFRSKNCFLIWRAMPLLALRERGWESWFMLLLSTNMILMDQVVCANYSTEKQLSGYSASLRLKNHHSDWDLYFCLVWSIKSETYICLLICLTSPLCSINICLHGDITFFQYCQGNIISCCITEHNILESANNNTYHKYVINVS